MSPAATVYIVSSGPGVAQAFAHLRDAELFASEDPSARITCTHVRQSMDEAVTIFDRRVHLTQGATVLDDTRIVHRFVDDPGDRPDPADVEWFPDTAGSGWHIAGFGFDRAALDAQVHRAIDGLRLAAVGTVGGAAS